MSTVLEISVALIILTLISKYITFVLNFCGIFLPSIFYKFILLVIAISIVQYIINRKDD